MNIFIRTKCNFSFQSARSDKTVQFKNKIYAFLEECEKHSITARERI
jgi:hypothetical protein